MTFDVATSGGYLCCIPQGHSKITQRCDTISGAQASEFRLDSQCNKVRNAVLEHRGKGRGVKVLPWP